MTIELIGITGSIRKNSCNTGLLRAAAELLAGKARLEIIGCGNLPLYNSELDGEAKPAEVVNFINKIKRAQGILVATPEYNYSFSGVLKNGIDWASRPAYKSVLASKPTAIVSAAKGHVGGARAQNHLRDVFSATLTPVVPSPPFLAPEAQSKCDGATGDLTDDETRRRLSRYLEDFLCWVIKLS